MGEALRWYLALAAVGAGGLLPAMLVFGHLRSGGVLFARPLALLLVAYAAWTLSALGVAPYGGGLVLAATALLWAWSAALALRRPALLRALRPRIPLLLTGELLFIALFALVTFVRAGAPAAINTEKPMDLLMLTAVHEADRMPPLDPWFAGERISYYHLGYVTVDATARLAGTGVATAFNLGLAATGAMAGAAVFALAGDVAALSSLRRRRSTWVAGAVAVAGLLFVSTLVGPLQLLTANGAGGGLPWDRLGVDALPALSETTHLVPDRFWWWWGATRVLPGTITEFPAFSLILGDLHPHVLALPFGVVALALAAATLAAPEAPTVRSWRERPAALLLAAAIFGSLLMVNSWDAALYGGVWYAAALTASAGAGRALPRAALDAAAFVALPAAGALLAALPFLVTVEGGALGLDLVTDGGSDPARTALVWLPLLMPLAAAALLLRPRVDGRAAIRSAAMLALLPLAWAVAALLLPRPEALAARGAGWPVLAALVAGGAVLAGAAVRARREEDRASAAWLGLAALVAATVLGTELVRLVDNMDNRLNTVFKFWFASWLLLAIAGGAALAVALDRLRRDPGRLVAGAAALAALVFGASMLYAPAAAVSRAREGQPRGLDALAFLERDDPGRAAALRWVREHLDTEDVLLETTGRPYTSASFLSAASGVPTLLGWAQHEYQWRGDAEAIAERERALDAIYRAGATDEGKAIAIAWDVTHIYIGREEQSRYGPSVVSRFAGWPSVFEAGESRIVAVPR